MSKSNYDFDYIIVGSGFGGSVSAMRLSQKGYKVCVIESGKKWNSKDFATRNPLYLDLLLKSMDPGLFYPPPQNGTVKILQRETGISTSFCGCRKFFYMAYRG